MKKKFRFYYDLLPVLADRPTTTAEYNDDLMDENDNGYFTSEDEDDENSLNQISPNETRKETIPSGMCFISHVLFPALV